MPKRVSRPSSSLLLSARTRAVHSTTPSQVRSLSTDHLPVRGRPIDVTSYLLEGKLVAARVFGRAPAGDDLGYGADRVTGSAVPHPHAPSPAPLAGTAPRAPPAR